MSGGSISIRVMYEPFDCDQKYAKSATKSEPRGTCESTKCGEIPRCSTNTEGCSSSSCCSSLSRALVSRSRSKAAASSTRLTDSQSNTWLISFFDFEPPNAESAKYGLSG